MSQGIEEQYVELLEQARVQREKEADEILELRAKRVSSFDILISEFTLFNIEIFAHREDVKLKRGVVAWMRRDYNFWKITKFSEQRWRRKSQNFVKEV